MGGIGAVFGASVGSAIVVLRSVSDPFFIKDYRSTTGVDCGARGQESAESGDELRLGQTSAYETFYRPLSIIPAGR
jgi:hypothetical protein